MEYNENNDTEIVDYTDSIRESAFLGDYPFNEIMAGIERQFNDYIGTDDDTNYVDIFYDQMDESFTAAKHDNLQPQELMEILKQIYSEFISQINRLFNKRLMINIHSIESEDVDDEDIDEIIIKLYEYFILNAKNNFKAVIGADITAKINTVLLDDDEYFNKIEELLEYYSPIVREIGPMEFIKYSGNMDIYELFDSGKVNGNFLKKYSPKLYQYDEFKVELINHITMLETKEEKDDGRQTTDTNINTN